MTVADDTSSDTTMFVPFVVMVAASAVSFIIFKSKKTLNHVMLEIKYEFLVQVVGFHALFDDFHKRKRNMLRTLPPRAGEVAVITGGARGIGSEIVKTLLNCKMRVVMGVRNPEAAKKMIEEFKKQGIPANADILQLDVSSMKSVESFGSKVSKAYPEISLLINNAAIMFGKYKVTEDGFESQLATNYIGHFYLTHLLLANLKRGGEKNDVCSRIVNVSSCAHYPGEIFFDDMHMKVNYISSAAYVQSKLGQVMFGRYLNAKLEAEGSKVKCFSVHPGIVNTDLFVDSPFGKYGRWFMNSCFKTPAQGATSVLYACLSPKLESRGGLYVSNCGKGISNKYSEDVDAQKRLFDVTCKMVNIKQFGVAQS